MADDISAALLYQVKKEIAENYFGARKGIEEEKAALAERVKVHRDTAGKLVYQDFCRIYQILGSKALVQQFWEIVGIETQVFYDRYLLEAGDIASCLLKTVKTRGLTRHGRYRNLLLDCYKLLVKDIERYREGQADLEEERLIINEEIAQLSANYSLTEILTFVHSIEDVGSLAGVLGANTVPTQRQDLETKLAMHKLESLGEEHIELPPLPPLSTVKGKLKRLAEKAMEGRAARLP